MTVQTQPVETRRGVSNLPQRNLRLAFLTNQLTPYWKCIFDSLSRIYPHLRILVSTRMEDNRAWDMDWNGLPVVLQKTITLRGRWRHPKGFEEPLFIHMPLDTVAQLGSFQPDVVISCEMGFRTTMALIYRKLHPVAQTYMPLRSRRLLILAEIAEGTEHGRGLARRLLRSFLAKHADGFIVVGESGARHLRRMGASESRIFPIPYPADVNRFGLCAVERGEQAARKLLYVGQLSERKGLVQLISVISSWAAAHPDRAIDFHLVGDGPLRNRLQNAPVPDNVKLSFRGNVAHSDLPSAYAESGIFVFPTLADSWGVVVNEALASGLPVLGSVYSQAVNELVECGKNGWRFRPDDFEEASRMFHQVMSCSVDELNRMRHRARARAMSITPEYVAERIDRIVAQFSGAV